MWLRAQPRTAQPLLVGFLLKRVVVAIGRANQAGVLLVRDISLQLRGRLHHVQTKGWFEE